MIFSPLFEKYIHSYSFIFRKLVAISSFENLLFFLNRKIPKTRTMKLYFLSFQIQAGNGEVTITNDGATILKQINVTHPAAKMVKFTNLKNKFNIIKICEYIFLSQF